MEEQLHDMKIWLVSWYTQILLEANKLWFYAICLSISRAVIQLFSAPAKPRNATNGHTKTANKNNSQSAHSFGSAPIELILAKRVVADSCDLTLPGSFVGWIPIGDLGVGIAMFLSTMFSLSQVWGTTLQN